MYVFFIHVFSHKLPMLFWFRATYYMGHYLLKKYNLFFHK